MASKAKKIISKKSENILKTTVKGAGTLALNDLTPLQGELKTLERANYEKYRKSFIDHGISFVTHIWKHKGKNNIIDGHQGRFTLRKMRDEEGWKIPPIPVAYVEAKNIEEAKLKVLVAASEFGTMTEQSLFDFMKKADIPYDEIVASMALTAIDNSKFMAMFKDMPKVENLPAVQNNGAGSEMKHSSDGVRQVILFFNAANHEEFIALTTGLSKKYGKENISDTLLEVVREASPREAKKHNRVAEAVR